MGLTVEPGQKSFGFSLSHLSQQLEVFSGLLVEPFTLVLISISHLSLILATPHVNQNTVANNPADMALRTLFGHAILMSLKVFLLLLLLYLELVEPRTKVKVTHDRLLNYKCSHVCHACKIYCTCMFLFLNYKCVYTKRNELTIEHCNGYDHRCMLWWGIVACTIQ